ncbi:hypothetical protein Aperf_G00000119317 [Anoplocephala perfoliata]
MQTSISTEEFARFQTQLLDLRQAKYSAEDKLIKAEKKVNSLETALAHQSGELAELRSRLSCIQRAADIETLTKENNSLRQRLLNVESSFQLQCSTLRAECERLQAENTLLKQNCHVLSSKSHIETQTEHIIMVNTASQSYKSGWASVENQTEITSSEVEEWCSKAAKLDNLTEVLEAERKTSEDLLREVARREIDVERLEGELEALRSELAVTEKRSEKVQRELQRQLASAMRAVKKASKSGKAPSLSSLVLVPAEASLDGISVDSFTMCQVQSGNELGGGGSETSSDSQIQQQILRQQQILFSEEDLKGLLARLSEVQEENCTLRHQLKKQKLELDAKSKIIQRTINVKLNPNGLPLQATSAESPSNASVQNSSSSMGSVPKRFATDMISALRSKIKSLEASSSAAALNTVELKGLKRLCEELMTRNISLERALEAAIAGSREELED